MFQVSDKEFEAAINLAIDSLPEERIKGLKNVVITFEDEPDEYQRKKLSLRGSQTLFGLYEGIPLTKRAGSSSILSGNVMTLPDKITIFKKPTESVSQDLKDLQEHVKHTLWHEIAHYYGLDHDQIRRLEN